jgi:hypothetical protein
MTPPRVDVEISLLRRVICGALLMLWYLPWHPTMPKARTDSGWALSLSIANERHLVFGRDVVFTFGPYGNLTTHQYWASSYWMSLALLAAVAGLAIWLFNSAARDTDEHTRFSLALAWLGITGDTMMYALPLAYAVQTYRIRRRSWANWLALPVLAVLALAKFTFLPVAVATIVASSAMRSTSRALEVTLDLSLFVLFLIAAWALMHQPVDQIYTYLINAAEISRGYAQAMAWPAGWSPLALVAFALNITVFGLASIVVLALIRQAFDDPSSAWSVRIAWLGLIALLCALAIRHGITRGDQYHMIIPAALTGALALIELPSSGRLRPTFLVVTGICALLTLGFAEARYQGKGEPVLIPHLEEAAYGASLIARVHDPRNDLASSYAASTASIDELRAQFSMVDGSYDILGHDQYLILALGAERWTPRPVLQGYSAYTEKLTRLDADYLAGPQAPRWLIARCETIDGRLPMMDDPAIWPIVARRYELAGRTASDHLILRQRRTPGIAVGAIADQTLRFVSADWTTLPDTPRTTWIATLNLPTPISDRIRSALWKPPVYFLELQTMRDNAVFRFRIVPEAAAAGFVLSPLITDTAVLAAWLNNDEQPQAHVHAMRVVDEFGHPVPAPVVLTPLNRH